MGMAGELLMRLSQIETLSVIARTSVMKYRRATKTIPEISRELGVAYLVDGSVQRAGGKVRIQVQLVDGRTGVHEWATSYTRRTSFSYRAGWPVGSPGSWRPRFGPAKNGN